MATSVLGKRERSPETSGCMRTRSKRQALLVDISNDENIEPLIEAIPVQPSLPLKATPRRGRPAKHSSPPNSRVTSCTESLNAHFGVSKALVDREHTNKDVKATPQTPKHRDALSKKSPSTPRHKILVGGTPKTPRTPATPSSACENPYTEARQIFSRCHGINTLVGRDDERQELSQFISSRLGSNDGGCLYVSGPPGTGKSALLNEVIQQYQSDASLRLSTINCMSIKSAADLAKKLTEELQLEYTSSRNAEFDHIRQCFFSKGSSKQRYVAILDEVDQLADLDLKLLYNLFEWSMQPSSKLILIGIANALDLTDRLLPRLKSRNLKPQLLPFMPYSATQIAQIVTTKLKSLNVACAGEDYVPFLHPAAIMFCSKKVAAQTGDLRKAFDICRRAIDLAEQEAKTEQSRLSLQDSPSKTPLMENINLASPPTQRSPLKAARQLKLSSSLSHLTAHTAPRATIAHMAKVTSAAFNNGATQRLKSLNIQQKAVLCALAGSEKKRHESRSNSIFATPSKTANTAPTIKQLFELYTKVCKRENLLHPLTSMEFRDVIGGLETLSLIAAVEGKNGSFAFPITPSKTPSRKGRAGFAGTAASGDERRMATCVGHQELLTSLQGAGSEILKDMLEGMEIA